MYIYTLSVSCFSPTGCEDFLDKREDAGGLDETAIYASYESIRGFWIKYTVNWTLITVW